MEQDNVCFPPLIVCRKSEDTAVNGGKGLPSVMSRNAIDRGGQARGVDSNRVQNRGGVRFPFRAKACGTDAGIGLFVAAGVVMNSIG